MRLSLALAAIAFVATVGSSRAAFGQSFTDDPLTAGTPVKAVHLTELRAAVANLRAGSGLPVFTFTDPTVTPTATAILAIHITELRSALNDVFDTKGTPRPTYTDAALTGVFIKAVHIQELQSAVVSLASSCLSGVGPLTNGGTHCGAITAAGQTDVWTFTATAGDRIAIHIGEITDQNGRFTPWIRLRAPNGTTELANQFGTSAAEIEAAIASTTGTYSVLVASADNLLNGTGTYRLTLARSSGAVIVSPGDQGGPLTNGLMHTGEIVRGDVDVWTFDANVGDRISVHIGEITDNNTFTPWIRLWAPNGTYLATQFGAGAAEIEAAIAPVTGTYLVLVSSADSGVAGTGTYRLTLARSSGSVSVSPGDQGGPLINGATHTGEILKGDVDVWTFDANVGDRISVHIGEITDNNTFTPWIRLWAPNGTYLATQFGADAAEIEAAIAPVTGTYLVLVSSADSGVDGTGTYRLTLARSSGAVTVSPGDQGGPLTNGAMHTGEILRGDVDVWTFDANVGDRISVHIGEITDNDAFTPWIRLWAPNGTYLATQFGAAAAEIEAAIAPVTGTYLVLVSSADSGVDGTGTYRLTLARSSGTVTVSPGDEGGPLTNGAMHTGEILKGDVDVWTFDATVGDRISVHIGQITDNDDFRPWIRLWAPNGTYLGTQFGTDAAEIEAAIAPVTGTYLVLVSSADSGVDGTGTYRLTLARSSGGVTVSPGDQGGPLTSGAVQTGEILKGDVDVWTIDAVAGGHISVHIAQITDNDDFRPWIRLWSPTGGYLGTQFGTDTADIVNALASVSGTYLVLVSSADSGVDGTGTYALTVTVTPP